MHEATRAIVRPLPEVMSSGHEPNESTNSISIGVSIPQPIRGDTSPNVLEANVQFRAELCASLRATHLAEVWAHPIISTLI